MYTYIIIIVFAIIFLATVKYRFSDPYTKNLYKDHCDTDEDCKIDGGGLSAECKYDPDFERKVCLNSGSIICQTGGGTDLGVLSDEELTYRSVFWEELGLTTCNEDTDCNKCMNEPQWGCFKFNDPEFDSNRSFAGAKKWINGDGYCPTTIKDGDPDPADCVPDPLIKKKIDGDDYSLWWCPSDDPLDRCKIEKPFTSSDGENPAGYCFPKVSVDKNTDGSDITCNKYTGDSLLTWHDDYSSQWSCNCKNPLMFDHIGTSGSDCTLVNACGESSGFGELFIQNDGANTCSVASDCEDNQACCLNDTDVDNHPGYHGKVCLDEEMTTTTAANGFLQTAGEEGEINWTCHTKFSESTPEVDWVKYGKCKCEPRHTYISTDRTEFTEGGDEKLWTDYTSTKTCVRDICHLPLNDEGYTGPSKIKNSDISQEFSCICPSSSSDGQGGSKLSYSIPHDLALPPDTEDGDWTPYQMKDGGGGASEQLSTTINDYTGRPDHTTPQTGLVVPVCLENPCGHGSLQTWDGSGEDNPGWEWCNSPPCAGCVCGDGGDQPVPTVNNWFGETCADPCRDKTLCANRGVCKTKVFDGGVVAYCDECECPYYNACTKFKSSTDCNESGYTTAHGSNCHWVQPVEGDAETGTCELNLEPTIGMKKYQTGEGAEYYISDKACELRDSYVAFNSICSNEDEKCCGPPNIPKEGGDKISSYPYDGRCKGGGDDSEWWAALKQLTRIPPNAAPWICSEDTE